MNNKSAELISLLIKNKAVDQAELEKIRELPEFSDRPEEALVSQGLVDAEVLAELKAKVYKLSYKNLLDFKIPDQVLNLIPLEVAENYQIICFEVGGGKMKFGMVDPENFKAIEAIDFLAKEENLTPEIYLISGASLANALKHYKTLSKEVSKALKSKEEEEVREQARKKIKIEEVEEITKSAPVSKIVSVIIRHAVEGRASDIHIEPMAKESRVRYRIDGIL
ncbi:hypothetical protein GW814_01020, partial [Candidatus Falkowbacteria bacterium]|nr:hypothetical protein [Candidatus Falkowbacteria bacterium]